MIHINIITLGKLKEIYWQSAEAEYLKRLKPYAKIIIHELREESFTEKDKPEIIKQKEAEKIKKELEKIPNSYIIILDEHGEQFSSTEFSKFLNLSADRHDNKTMWQWNNITFIIGGPLGLDESVIKIAKTKFSLSKMTFTHQMVRIFLLEQIYRGIMIKENRKYHY